MSRPTCRLASRNSRAVLFALPLVLLAGSLLATAAFAGSTDWVTYVDETASRLSAIPSLGSADEEEKDFVAGDVDKDGDSDLIVVRKVPFSNPGGRPNVLYMNENGVLTDRTTQLAPDFLDSTDDRDVVLVDLDGDTWLDMVVAGTFDEQPRVLMNLGETMGGVWRGFDYQANRLPTFSPGPQFCALAAGDVTGDGRPEIYFADYDNNLEDKLMINDGSGFFTDDTAARLTTAMSNSVFGTDVHIVDINGDTFKDIVKNNASGSSPPPGFQPAVSVFYNDGTGHFTFKDDIYTEAGYMIEPADFTQNGRIDLFVVDDGQDRYLRNTGNDGQGHAVFTTHTVTSSPNTSFFGGNVKFADLDNDGILDVLVADVDTDLGGCDREMTLLRGQGTPPAIDYSDPVVGASRPWLLSGVFDIEAMHVDNDGVLDLVVGTCTGTHIFMGLVVSVFANDFETGDTSGWDAAVP